MTGAIDNLPCEGVQDASDKHQIRTPFVSSTPESSLSPGDKELNKHVLRTINAWKAHHVSVLPRDKLVQRVFIVLRDARVCVIKLTDFINSFSSSISSLASSRAAFCCSFTVVSCFMLCCSLVTRGPEEQ